MKNHFNFDPSSGPLPLLILCLSIEITKYIAVSDNTVDKFDINCDWNGDRKQARIMIMWTNKNYFYVILVRIIKDDHQSCPI